MSRLTRAFAAAVVLLGAVAAGAPDTAKKPKQLIVIPFEFDTSSFADENNEYSEKMGFMFWKKIQRKGGFVLPESMLDVRDACGQLDFRPTADTSLVKMSKTVTESFGGHIGIWGKLHRLSPDRYEIWIKIVDFTGEEPEYIVNDHGIAENVHEVPHKYVKNAMMKLYNEKAPPPPGPDPEVERRWATGPNLVRNGDFEQAGPDGAPKYWDPLPKNPDGYSVTRVPTPDGDGWCMKLDMNTLRGDTYGVQYYSFYFPIDEYAKYRCQLRWRSTGPAVKIFLKAYAEMVEYDEAGKKILYKQWRECYRSQQNAKGGSNQWHLRIEDFTPKHTKYSPRKMRVMLYGYTGAGTVFFDDVVIKQIKPAPKDIPPKQRRHSLETGILLEEYEKEHAKYGEHKAGDKPDATDVSTGTDAPTSAPTEKPKPEDPKAGK